MSVSDCEGAPSAFLFEMVTGGLRGGASSAQVWSTHIL